jgi:hypothetical protein
MTNRQRLLATRIHANAQRRSRDQLFGKLDDTLRRQLERAQCIYSPDADSVLRRVVWTSEDRVGTTPAAGLAGFRFITTGKPQRVLDCLRAIPTTHDFDPGILILPGVKVIKLGEATECVPTYPLFRLRFGEARRLLERLWQPRAHFSGAFAESFAAGILIDSYGEDPEVDAGPDECTYEVASWAAA